jgi:hypothetical protein
METLKLHLDHEVLTECCKNGERFVAVWIERDQAYCTYAVDKEGNCYWGHYMLAHRGEAIADLSKRSGVPLDAFPPEVQAMAQGRVGA